MDATEYYKRKRAIERRWFNRGVTAMVVCVGFVLTAAVNGGDWLLYVGVAVSGALIFAAASAEMKATNELNRERGPRATDEVIKGHGFQEPEQLVDATNGWWIWEKIPLSTAIRYGRWWRPSK